MASELFDTVEDEEVRRILAAIKSDQKLRDDNLKLLVDLTFHKQDEETRNKFTDAGAIPILVDLVKPTNSPALLGNLLLALIHLTRSKFARDVVREAGFLPKLVNLLKMARHLQAGSAVKQRTVQLTINLHTANPENKQYLAGEAAAVALVRLLKAMHFTDEPNSVADHTMLAVHLTCSGNLPKEQKDQIVEVGGLSDIVRGLRSAHAATVKYAAGSLLALCRNHEVSRATIRRVPHMARNLLRGLGLPELETANPRAGLEQEPTTAVCAQLLAALCVSSQPFCAAVREQGGIPLLCHFIGFDASDGAKEVKLVQLHTVTALMHMTKNDPGSKDAIRKDMTGLQHLVALIRAHEQDVDPIVQQRAVWTVNNLCTNNGTNQSALRDAGAINALLAYLSARTPERDMADLKGAAAACMHLMEGKRARRDFLELDGLVVLLFHALRASAHRLEEAPLFLLALRFLCSDSRSAQKAIRHIGGSALFRAVQTANIASDALPRPPSVRRGSSQMALEEEIAALTVDADRIDEDADPDEAIQVPQRPLAASTSGLFAMAEHGHRSPDRSPDRGALPDDEEAQSLALADLADALDDFTGTKRALLQATSVEQFAQCLDRLVNETEEDRKKEETERAEAAEKEAEFKQKQEELRMQLEVERLQRLQEQEEARKQAAIVAEEEALQAAEKARVDAAQEAKEAARRALMRDMEALVVARVLDLTDAECTAVRKARAATADRANFERAAAAVHAAAHAVPAAPSLAAMKQAFQECQRCFALAEKTGQRIHATVQQVVDSAFRAMPSQHRAKDASVAAEEELKSVAEGLMMLKQTMRQARDLVREREEAHAICQGIVAHAVTAAVVNAELVYDLVDEAVEACEAERARRAEEARLKKEAAVRRELARLQALDMFIREEVVCAAVYTAVEDIEAKYARMEAEQAAAAAAEARAEAERREMLRSVRARVGGAGDDERLVRAVLSCDAEAAQVLAANGADVHQTTTGGYTLLHEAAELGSAGTVEVLVQGGAALEARTHKGSTPLLTAALKGHRGVVEALLAGGADPRARSGRGDTALHCAAARGHDGTAAALLEGGASFADPDAGGNSAVHVAAFFQHCSVVRAIVEFSLHIEADDLPHPALLPPPEPGHGDEPEERDRELQTLDIAIFQGQTSPTKQQVKHWGPVCSAVTLANHHLVTPLHVSAASGNLEVIEYLLSMGANPNVQDKAGYTPLHLAAYRGQALCAKALLDGGASLNKRTADGHTPRELACGVTSNEQTRRVVNYAAGLPEYQGEVW